MAGYTRQSEAELTSGAPMSAAPVAAEFDALEAAFSGATGHSHSGGAGEGPKISYNNLTDKPTVPSLSSSTPSALGSSGSAGVATSASRSDHVHARPTPAEIGAATTAHTHSNATSGAAGFMSAADKTKLDGIATGAQVGTVTSIAAGTGMSFSTITGSGTIAIDTAVVPRLTATNDFGENIIKNVTLNDVGHTVQALGSVSGSQNVDISVGHFITATIPSSSNLTINFTGTQSGKAHRVLLLVTMGNSASSLTISNDQTTGGVSIPYTPTSTSANSNSYGTGTHLLEAVTFNGGTSWYLFRHVAVAS